MVLLIDNYDSFVHNLARYVRELGEEAVVVRNDKVTLDDIAALRPERIILSPGPCTPGEAGVSTGVVQRFGPVKPVLGVCLGHQCIGAAYGAEIVRAGKPVHGRTSEVIHDGSGVFAGIGSPLIGARYHSLVIAHGSLPPALRLVGYATDDGEIMAVEHVMHPVYGVQFHPESAATRHGHDLIANFLRLDASKHLRPHRPDARRLVS